MGFPGKQISNSVQSKSEGYWLIIIVLFAIFLRVAAALVAGNQVVDLPGTFDQISYDMLAQRVLAGYGFTVAVDWWPVTRAGEPTAHWSYLYTLYLAVVYGLFGYQPLVPRLIQAVVAGLLMPWLVYRLGRRHFGTRVGLLAAGLMAVYAYFVYYAATLMTETFYIIAILWTLDLAGQLGQAPAERQNAECRMQNVKPEVWGLFLGLALATAVLLRQVFLLFIPILFGWLLWRSYRYQAKPFVQMLRILGVAAIILVLSIAPWTIRNFQAFNQFVLLNTNAGFAFFWGNHPIHGYNFIDILPASGPSYQDLIPPELRHLNEAELDQALLKRAIGLVQADPARYLILSLSRLKDYFKFWPSPDSSFISNVSRVVSFGLLWPFMIYGLVVSLRRSLTTTTLILTLFVIIYTVVHLLSWALIRYRLPIDAVLLVFAGLAVSEVWVRLLRYRARVRPAGIIAPEDVYFK
jgi:4-amino-4-deoxy-L-arabinose transferase-like glycosyltransferase